MPGAEKLLVRVRVNGEPREALVEPRTLLVELLREHFNLTGTHIGCDTTYCGACTVLLNGRSIKSCTLFAPMAEGCEIITVEGLSKNGELHPSNRRLRNAMGCNAVFARPDCCFPLYTCCRKRLGPPKRKFARGSPAIPAVARGIKMF